MTKRVNVSRVRIAIPIRDVTLAGELSLPGNARGLVIFAHDTPGSRHCPCNTVVADTLHAAGIGALLFDLLSDAEINAENGPSQLCSGVPFLAGRIVGVTRWIIGDRICRDLRLGYCGARAGGAASLVAAAWLGKAVDAVVTRSAHPEKADTALQRVVSPTLLIAPGRNAELIRVNKRAIAHMHCERELAVVSRATDLFEEPEVLRQVATLAAGWFDRHLLRS